MKFAVYRLADGALQSIGTVVADGQVLAARGLAVVEVDDAASASHAWNPATHAFDLPLPVPPRVLTPLEFKSLLTPQERIAIRASADPVVVDFLDMLNSAQEVVLDHPTTVAGVNYMVLVGLLTTDRAAEILNG